MKIKNLSKHDAITLLEVINQSLSCSSDEQFVHLMGRLGDLLPYQAAISCMGRFGENGALKEMKITNVDYPEEYLAELTQRGLLTKDPVVIENYKSFRLQYWADTFSQSDWSHDTHDIMSIAEDYGFSRVRQGYGYAHGVQNLKGTEGSFFCYHGLERSSRSEEILTLVIPHLHVALNRLAGIPKKCSPLTPKETEIINWVKEGKSTWDISVILGISERTVKFHVGNIMHKLDATTRTHAVAIAMEQGFVDID